MRAVAAVTFRRSLHSSLTCLRCTPMASASAPWVKLSGRMNSSVRISPTVAGLRFVVSMGRLASPVAMVVQIDALRLTSAAIPPENQPPLLVDADRTKSCQIAAQLLEVVAGRYAQ